ncbi:MAG: oligoendopeptidase F [Eubacteriales bacterium]
MATLERNQQKTEDLWSIHDLYVTDDLWKIDFETLKALVPTVASYAGTLSQNSHILLEYLRLDDQIGMMLDKLSNYASRRSDEDTRVATYQAMEGQIHSLWVEIVGASSFFSNELLTIPQETLDEFYEEVPELLVYRRALQQIQRKREHVLSPAEEKLLAGVRELSSTPSNVYSMFSDADVKFPDVVDSKGEAYTLTQSTYVRLLESGDRTLRKNAFETYYEVLSGFSNTMAATLNGQVKQLEFFAKARKYQSSLQASLDSTEVPTSVYHNLIDTIHNHLDKMHRYVRLRKKILGLGDLHMYDIYTPLVADCDVKIPFSDAKAGVMEAVAPMGTDYQAILQEGYDKGWIDVYENVGKRSGAYSAGAAVHPFVLLNYDGSLDSQFTLAHEMGHAIHSYLSHKHQPYVDSDYVIFVAEVASTCNEALLMQHLLGETTDKAQWMYLVNHFLDQFKGTMFRQVMFAEFELKIAELNANGTTLTAELLQEVYGDLNRQYYGEDMAEDREIAMEWARIPHFYYNYYVFQYATGFAAAMALSSKILAEGKPAVDNYLAFLSGGCSKDPIALLQGAGVDMTTSAPIDEAMAIFGDLLDQMERAVEEG